MIKIENFIDGKNSAPISGEYLDNYNPARGVVYSQLPNSDEKDVDRAVKAAQKAFPQWSKTTSVERAQILNRIADEIDRRCDQLAEVESIDQGKPLHLARSIEIPRAALNFRFFASNILQQSRQATEMDGLAINYVVRKPVGVAGLISPWNLPLYLLTWKIAPAIAFGNTCVCKPSEVTPMTAFLLGDILNAAGVPPGVVNIVFGLGAKAGDALVRHPDVPLISFTGGTKTGEVIAKTAAPQFKKLSLELGGKNPNIIFDDVDLKEVIATTLRSSFQNQGEICLCGSRIFVHKKIYEEFLTEFQKATEQLKVGDPMEEGTFMGALASKEHFEKVKSYIELAKSEGGTILSGGESPELSNELSEGYFLKPTIITGLTPSCRVMQEEIFGPVVSVVPFSTEDEVLEWANGIPYGLSASLWTNDIKRAHRVAQSLEVGTVWVNTWMLRDLRVPFGGQKDSGVGREGGEHSLEFFTETTNVCIKL